MALYTVRLLGLLISGSKGILTISLSLNVLIKVAYLVNGGIDSKV